MKQSFAAIFGITALSSMVLVTGCSTPKLSGIYRMDIQQGNVITADMLKRLEPRMTKRKVRFVLGTPLISDPFNDNRWDYVYTRQTGTDGRVQRRISVLFDGDELDRIEGDIEPALLREPPPRRNDQIVDVVGPRKPDSLLEGIFESDDEGGTGFWDNLIGGKKQPRRLRPPKKKEVEPQEAAAAANTDDKPTANGTGSGASVNVLPKQPQDAEPLPPPGVQGAQGDAANASAESETKSVVSTSDDIPAAATSTESDGSPSLLERLISPSQTSATTEEGTSPNQPSVKSVERTSSTSATDTTEATQSTGTASALTTSITDVQPEVEPARTGDGGLFGRIRDRFKLSEASALIEFKPPENDRLEDR